LAQLQAKVNQLKTSTGDIHNYIQWYIQYPYLIRLRDEVLKLDLTQRLAGNATLTEGTVQFTLLPFVTNMLHALLTDTNTDLNAIVTALGQPANTKWTTMQERIKKTWAFWNTPVRTYTYGFFLTALWSHERTKFLYDDTLQTAMSTILNAQLPAP
jgi:hypothetical protein